ncbi:AlwI family type II restriction endonuclease [Rhodoluna limnophila]|uniref:AlwI family type II restriction endonuclease n=1 Tax=Rhodoluna limnophila TaxID=232537 RepID=UPI0011069137|nr:AlwI family type II restriction endonuclease [Rhodoluna limnophila]
MPSEETALTRAWFFPTSPRSPYKIKPELELLKQVEDLPWTRDKGQAKYAQLLAEAATFEGAISSEEPTFSARDRTRAPKILGLVEQVGRGSGATLKLTPAGREFLTLEEKQETAFFLNQIAKVQFPSAQHSARGFRQMDCRPLTVALKIMLSVGAVTKEEFGLFVLTCIRENQIQTSIDEINAFRLAIRQAAPGLERKALKDKLMNDKVASVYAEDIARGNTGLREGGSDFIATKRRTLAQDYADSSFRYLLATGLFRIEPHGRTFSIVESKRNFATNLIADLGLGSTFSEYPPEHYTQEYLGNPAEPEITEFSESTQLRRLNEILQVKATLSSEMAIHTKNLKEISEGYKRELYIEGIAEEHTKASLAAKSIQLVTNRSSVTPEILQTFEEIVARDSGMLDKPLFFEWNTWRAFTALNDALNVVGNFRCDSEGNPLGTASGKQADIVAEYETFWLAIEVTLQSGHKQYESESESITRHVGTLQSHVRDTGDTRPVYGVFIAPTVNETVLNYLMTQANMNSNIYKGPVKIAPLNLEDFKSFFAKHGDVESTSSERLHNALESIFQEDLVKSGNEPLWFENAKETFRALELA